MIKKGHSHGWPHWDVATVQWMWFLWERNKGMEMDCLETLDGGS